MKALKPSQYSIGQDESTGLPTILFRDASGRKCCHTLNCGADDFFTVLREGSLTLVLRENYGGFPYIGMQAFDGDRVEGQVSFHEHEVDEALGKDWEGKSVYWKAKMLMNWLESPVRSV